MANPHAATSVGAVNMTYDPDGNLITRSDGFTHTWDYNDRLTKVVMPGQQGFGFSLMALGGAPAQTNMTYGYDPSGQRIWMKPKSTATTTYPSIYFNTDLTTQRDHIFANGVPVATVEASSTTQIFWNSQDQLQSTAVVTNSSAQIVEQPEYYAFGEIRSNTGTHREQRKYTGHEYDSIPDYTYAGARYLNTKMGRFLSEDPAFLAVGSPMLEQNVQQSLERYLADPQGMNSYSYARNNPLKYRDPDGKFFGVEDVAGFLIGGAVGVGVQATISYLAGQTPTWGEIGGAFISGGITGVGVANIPETGGLSAIGAAALVGGASGLFGNGTKQIIDVSTGAQNGYNAKELGVSTGAGFVFGGLTEGLLPNAKIPGFSSGQGNMYAVGKGIETKFANGTISSVSGSTAFKSAIGSQASNAYKTIADLLFQLGQLLATLQALQSAAH